MTGGAFLSQKVRKSGIVAFGSAKIGREDEVGLSKIGGALARLHQGDKKIDVSDRRKHGPEMECQEMP